MTTYTTPSTQTTSTLITADIYNQQIINNIAHLATAHKCQLITTTDFTHNSTGNYVKIAFDSEQDDTDSYHDNSTNNTRITIPTGLAGYYAFHGRVRWAGNTTGIRELQILLNNTTVLAQAEPIAVPTAAAQFQFIYGEYDLAEGDYIEFQAYQNSGGNLAIQLAGVRSPIFYARWMGY